MTAPMFLLIVIMFAITDAVAVNQGDSDKTPAADPPDAELLEFIAGFERVDGAWIDPMHFYDIAVAGNKTKENDHE